MDTVITINVVEWVLYLVVIWLVLILGDITLNLYKGYLEWQIQKEKKRKNQMIEFSIGPDTQANHVHTINWLKTNRDFKLIRISYQGDHFSEILVYGDYNQAYKALAPIKGISLEHWEED